MIKKALTEFREASVTTDERIVNGKRDASAVATKSTTKNGKGARVTVVDTNKTKPAAVIEKLAKKDKLEPGDIVLTTSTVKSNYDRFVQSSFNLAQGGFNHASMYTGNGNIVDGVPTKGFRRRPLSDLVKGKSYTVIRPNVSKKIRKAAANNAKSAVGKNYSGTDLNVTGPSLALLPDFLRKSLTGTSTKTPKFQKQTEYQCAGMVAGAYSKAGKNLSKLDYRYTAPVDLIADGDVTVVKYKQNKKATIQGAPFTFTGAASRAKKKVKPFMDKTASAGCLNLFCHVDASDWCPNGDVISKLSRFFTKNVDVEIYPRSLVAKVWEKDHCGKPYTKDYYAFRAYAGPDYCRIFVDETETKDSVLWVMLHELAHIGLASSPFLFKGYRHLTPSDYHESDDAHERDPEEQMANQIAMSWMDMLGYGKVCYPRHWWRSRTMMNKKANAAITNALIGGGVGSGLSGVKSLLHYNRLNREADFKRQMANRPYTAKSKAFRRQQQLESIKGSMLGGGITGSALGGLGTLASQRLYRGADDVVRKGKRALDEGLDVAKNKLDEVVDTGVKKGRKAFDEAVDRATDVNADKVQKRMDESINKGMDRAVDKADEFVDRQTAKLPWPFNRGHKKSAAALRLYHNRIRR